MDNINRVLNGQKTVTQGLTYTVVDAENGLPDEGQAYKGPLDWKAAYEKSWAAAAG
jgi:ribose transport system substrate-binding protein